MGKHLTFILGAGASVPYGLPTGDELVRKVAARMQSDANASVQNLGHKLALYDPLSIDSYLMRYYSGSEHREDLESYKAYIACEIMFSIQEAWLGNSESTKKFDVSNKENWLRFLIPELLDIYKNSPKKECPIKIITFNYDLAIEFYLQRVLARFAQTKEFKNSFFKWVSESIIHIYGQVGGYDWQDCDQSTWNTWQNVIDCHWISSAGARFDPRDLLRFGYSFQSNIRVIGEPNRALDKQLQTAKSWIVNSKTLLITGYAYHSENNHLLELEDVGKQPIHVIAGVYGAHRKLRERVERLFQVGINTATNTYEHRLKEFNSNQPNNPILSVYDLTTYDILKFEHSLSELYE